MNERNIEIWSTRLQREILALESSDDESKKIELLPTFITTIGHTLNIEGGIAKVEFQIDVEKGERKDSVDADAAADNNEAETNVQDGKVNNSDGTEEEAAQEIENTDNTEPNEEEAKPDTDETAQEEKPSPDNNHVVLVLDASLYWNDNSGNNDSAPMCYPFQKPLASLKSGAHLFSEESTISNGDEIVIDLDWTPSIHLSDAVTNVALKVS